MASLLPDTIRPATLLSRRFRFDQIPNLKGRVAIVTGGSAGIGFYNALPLAQQNAKVVIVSANEEKGKHAEAEINDNIKKQGSTGSVTWYGCDLGNLKQVDGLAKTLLSELDRLDILICNAGIGQAPYGLTNDGIERHFEVNNLSNFVLVNRLLPLMKKTAESAPPATVRIVMQSSEMHRLAASDVQFASKDEINQNGDGSRLYGRTKLGNILFAKQLVKRKISAKAHPILAMSVHPGTVDTEVQSAWTESYGNIVGKAMEVLTSKLGKTAAEGAEASLWAAVSTDINASNWEEFQGKYFSEPYGKSDTETNQAKDEALGDRFWELCFSLAKEILGERVE
ncbi:NAD(P)-binding protein [Panus rudis PR-1116 ss-1]|nr:NAD(P)-binding protein [Panus rudis PR-1116 ss-1]